MRQRILGNRKPFHDLAYGCGVGLAAHLAENATPPWSRQPLEPGDEIWLPEWSGHLGGVQRWRSSVAWGALGHNSKAVHHAYAKRAEVTMPSLDDWEKEWGKNSRCRVEPRLLQVDFRSSLAALAQSNLKA